MKALVSQKYRFKGFGGCDCICKVEIYAGQVVVVTELPENDGTSITNMAEQLATSVAHDFHLQPQTLTWIEKYPQDNFREEDDYSIVHFKIEGAKFSKPEWIYLSHDHFDVILEEAAAANSPVINQHI